MFDFKRIITLHNKLAKRLKEFESVDKNIPIEILNEYRYACRALVEALECQSNNNSEKFKHAEEEKKLKFSASLSRVIGVLF